MKLNHFFEEYINYFDNILLKINSIFDKINKEIFKYDDNITDIDNYFHYIDKKIKNIERIIKNSINYNTEKKDKYIKIIPYTDTMFLYIIHLILIIDYLNYFYSNIT